MAVEEDDRDEAQEEIQRNVLSTLIGVEIVAQMTDDLGLELTEEQLDEELAEQRELAGSDDAFEGFLQEIGLEEDEYRDLIVADAVRRNLLEAELGEEVTDEDVEAAYDAQLDANVNSRHILVEEEDVAEDLLERLDDGEDFAELAAEFGTDGTAQDGGNLGFSPTSNFVPEFQAALEENDPGDVVGPVETDFGFHIIEILDPPPLEEAEPEIRAELQQAGEAAPALVAAFEEAFTEADVAVDSAFGEWDAEQGRVVDPGAVGEGQPPTDEQPPADGQPPVDEEMTEEELQELLDELEGAEAP